MLKTASNLHVQQKYDLQLLIAKKLTILQLLKCTKIHIIFESVTNLHITIHP